MRLRKRRSPTGRASDGWGCESRESNSNSGPRLDPDITIAGAEFQVPRIARERGLSEAQVRQVIQQHTSGRQIGFLGEPRVNVLEVNLALDQMKMKKMAMK